MIRKIFLEEKNDERTNALKTVLEIEKIPYSYIKDAKENDFKEGLFLFTNEIDPKAKYQVIFNPELIEGSSRLVYKNVLKLRVLSGSILEVLKELNLSKDVEIPNVPVYKSENLPGQSLAKLIIDGNEHEAVIKEKNKVVFLFDILTLFINLISENYFEKTKEKNVLSNELIEKIYKLLPYSIRIPIYKRYYKNIHSKLDKNNEFITKFPVDPAGFALLELIKDVISIQTELAYIKRWPSVFNYATLITHDTEPTKYAYKKGLRILLNKLAEYNIKSTITIQGAYVKYINEEDKKDLKWHELGCHDLYHDRKFILISKEERTERLKEAKKIIENTFGKEINFFRAPALQRPNDLFDSLEETYYKYDSSIIDVQREEPFCGKGNSFYLPFYPVLNNKISKILELNVSAPDCISPYFFGYTMDETLELFRKKINFLEKANGLGVFIIHTPAWGKRDAKNRLKLLDEVIKNTRNSWAVTLSELTKWWDARNNLFLEIIDNRIYLINKNNSEVYDIKVKLGIKEINVEEISANEKILIK
ncbi:polysaccharide deacetylase family protein [Candidatus Woesearchaeota archaeon]|nr:polysaccharide deacetylase family protein [Candidatus Woesearchaeota archaeon]